MTFKAVQKNIAGKEHIPMGNAGAILAAATRNASPAAKKKNPNLKKVKGHNPHQAAAKRLLGVKDSDGDYDNGK